MNEKVVVVPIKPRFDPNCNNCIFLGEMCSFDLFICCSFDPRYAMMIAKYGTGLSDFLQSALSEKFYKRVQMAIDGHTKLPNIQDWEQEIIKRAREHKLIPDIIPE